MLAASSRAWRIPCRWTADDRKWPTAHEGSAGDRTVFERPTLTSVSRRAIPLREPVRLRKAHGAGPGGRCLDEIGERIATLLNMKVPDSLLANWRSAELAEWPSSRPGRSAASRRVRSFVIRERGCRSGAVSRAGVLAGRPAGPTSSRASSRAIRRARVRNVGCTASSDRRASWRCIGSVTGRAATGARWQSAAKRCPCIALGGDPVDLRRLRALPPRRRICLAFLAAASPSAQRPSESSDVRRSARRRP